MKIIREHHISHDKEKTPVSMRRAVMASVLFHLGVVGITMVSLPIFKSDDVIISAIPVELADISEITQTIKPPSAQQKMEEKPKPPEPPKPEPKTETPPPEKKEPEIKPEEKPEEVIPEKEPEPKKEEPPPPKKEEPKKEEPKKEEPKKEEPKPQRDLSSVLKNLETDEKQQQEQVGEESPDTSPVAHLGDKLTISELDAFRHQLEPCWNVPAGAKDAQDLAVEIRVYMNPDATLQKAVILDQSRYNRDTAFRAAADSAMRALRNQRCSPLRLPMDKYDMWKTIVINFDPKDML